VLERGENGKVYLTPQTQTVKLGRLAEEVIKECGNDRTRVRIVGMRPGEKLREKTHLRSEKNVVVGFNRRAGRESGRRSRTVLVQDGDLCREGASGMARVNP